MDKKILVLLIFIGILISGCDQVKETNENVGIITKMIKNDTYDNLDNNLTKIKENRDTYCEKDEDCILVLSGCPNCFPCRNIGITDPEVIAVNKNLYECPPRQKDVVCIACVGAIGYDPNEDAICVNNKCEKREVIETEEEVHDIF